MQATQDRRRRRALELCRDYHQRRRRQTPPWADRAAIKAVYDEAKRRSAVDEIAYDVDHVLPLRSDWVSGLHVAENLAIVPMSVNRSKGNRPGYHPRRQRHHGR
ncbi:hypothetical protein [Phenylobacterium sp.]|uniref:hypothetical protein n=1 Tax=Phenylobacterium sp. TaxID=1871053 RepID=UPI002F408E8E